MALVVMQFQAQIAFSLICNVKSFALVVLATVFIFTPEPSYCMKIYPYIELSRVYVEVKILVYT